MSIFPVRKEIYICIATSFIGVSSLGSSWLLSWRLPLLPRCLVTLEGKPPSPRGSYRGRPPRSAVSQPAIAHRASKSAAVLSVAYWIEESRRRWLLLPPTQLPSEVSIPETAFGSVLLTQLTEGILPPTDAFTSEFSKGLA